ncbi:iron uptake system protein EfeO [Nocardioides sp.]|uniref:iron uptake system protein EfeO n=1 Tax=Nocardioides sp. TaxID=35761 RepID=UPI0025D30E40|nr:iron uptake system protein EfeO [Nocardioides sp.]
MRKPLLVALVAALPLFAACTENTDRSEAADGGESRTITVTSTDDGCDLSATEAPSGTLTFEVANKGSAVTEFYLLGEDGQRIVGEVENIGPQLSRELVVSAPAGSYVTACKPGMKGEGIRDDFTVTASDQEPTAGTDDAAVDQALESYEDYVQEQTEQLVDKTGQFVALYKAGEDDRARALYPDARTHWERIETVAESFGDLDPKMDAREADLEPGQKWTGWHRIEKDLWPPADGYQALSAKLTFTVDQVANGSRGLLEEVANGKVTGEEEIWSHTDLWDFQANVDGARVAFEGLEPIVEQKDPELADTLESRFAELQKLLDAQRAGDGFVTYDQLAQDEVQALANAVNALAEPLSRLTAAVLS